MVKSPLKNLKQCCQDARALEKYFKEMGLATRLMTDINYKPENKDILAEFNKKIDNYITYSELNAQFADKSGSAVQVFVVTISCHGITYDGDTFAIIPQKNKDGVMDFTYMNIEKLGDKFAASKNSFTVILFDGCREKASDIHSEAIKKLL